MKKNPSHLNDILEAAKAHGEQGEPDHEVGDLQDALRKAWGMMNDVQKHEFLTAQTLIENYQIGMGITS